MPLALLLGFLLFSSFQCSEEESDCVCEQKTEYSITEKRTGYLKIGYNNIPDAVVILTPDEYGELDLFLCPESIPPTFLQDDRFKAGAKVSYRGEAKHLCSWTNSTIQPATQSIIGFKIDEIHYETH